MTLDVGALRWREDRQGDGKSEKSVRNVRKQYFCGSVPYGNFDSTGGSICAVLVGKYLLLPRFGQVR